MRILSRYVFREFLAPLTYCLAGFLGIYVIFELFESFNRFAEARPPFFEIVRFFAGYVSPYLEWLIPAALLLATLYTMWNFCRHSEITAMRASGIGFSVIVRPILLAAAAAAAAVACINEFYAPGASARARAFRESRFRPVNTKTYDDVVFYNYNPGGRRIWRVGKIAAAAPNVLDGVHISMERADRSREMDISCDRAEYLDGLWWLVHPVYHHYDTLNNPVPSPRPDLDKLTLRSFPEFDEAPRDFLLMNKGREFYSIRDTLHYLRRHPGLAPGERNDRLYDIHARLAAPFACLVITLFAIPAGISTSRQSVFLGVIQALAMFFGFYALSILCMVLCKNGFLPAAPAAWAANVLFLVLGCVNFYRQR